MIPETLIISARDGNAKEKFTVCRHESRQFSSSADVPSQCSNEARKGLVFRESRGALVTVQTNSLYHASQNMG